MLVQSSEARTKESEIIEVFGGILTFFHQQSEHDMINHVYNLGTMTCMTQPMPCLESWHDEMHDTTRTLGYSCGSMT